MLNYSFAHGSFSYREVIGSNLIVLPKLLLDNYYRQLPGNSLKGKSRVISYETKVARNWFAGNTTNMVNTYYK